MVSGIAALVGAGALVVAGLAVSLTLTRLADWMFYRRRWPLPLLAILLTGTAIMSLLSFGGPFKNGSERLLAVLWLLAAMAAQPLATLLVMGLTGYRLAPRKQPEPDASESSFQAATTTTEKPAANWFLRLQRPHIASLVAVLLFFVGFVPTGALNRHHLTIVSFWRSRLLNNAGEITHLTLSNGATNNSLRVLSDLDNLQSLGLNRTQVTDAGLVHLKAMTNLQRLGLDNTKVTDAGLMHLKGMTNLRVLDLYSAQGHMGVRLGHWEITDAGLVHIKGMTKLQELDLRGTKVTDAGLVHLKGMNLKLLGIPGPATTDLGLKNYMAACAASRTTLGLSNWKISDAGLMHLKGLTNLKSLDLSYTQVTDAGLVHLKGLTRLMSLKLNKLRHLNNTPITDAGLVHLKGLTNLQTLWIEGTQVSDAGLVHLKEMSSLWDLRLHDTKITDAGLVHLKGLTNLEQLWLVGTKITDAGLADIKGLTKLRKLRLGFNPMITRAGIADLQKALPNCDIR